MTRHPASVSRDPVTRASGRFRKTGMRAIPAGRFGEPEELTNLATFLVSDYSNWISGEVSC